MSTEPFIGEIKLFGFNFAPKMYMFCYGQILAISSNTALFALLGTTYGGNGQTTFALPDLRGRMAIGQGTGPGLPSYSLGEVSGTPSVTLLSSNLPAHMHGLHSAQVKLQASTDTADEQAAAGNFPATASASVYSGNGPTPNTFTGGATLGGTTDISGSNLPVSVMNPYLVLNYSIATYGIFPSRN